MRGGVLILLLALGVPGCGGDEQGDAGTSAARLSPMCQERPDDATPGCFATPSSMLCAPAGCQSLCSQGQTPVTCSSAQATGPIPVPDAHAGCTAVVIPTPSSELFYCCPCSAP